MTKFEIGTLSHAFRTEMSQVIHWSLIIATAIIAGLQISQAGASDIQPINEVYKYLLY
jgi:hypothetical protein